MYIQQHYYTVQRYFYNEILLISLLKKIAWMNLERLIMLAPDVFLLLQDCCPLQQLVHTCGGRYFFWVQLSSPKYVRGFSFHLFLVGNRTHSTITNIFKQQSCHDCVHDLLRSKRALIIAKRFIVVQHLGSSPIVHNAKYQTLNWIYFYLTFLVISQ